MIILDLGLDTQNHHSFMTKSGTIDRFCHTVYTLQIWLHLAHDTPDSPYNYGDFEYPGPVKVVVVNV